MASPRSPLERKKRLIKNSGGVLQKGLSIPDDLFELPPDVLLQVAASLGVSEAETRDDDSLRKAVNHRDLMSAAVAAHLSELVSALLKAGLGPQHKPSRRPRAIDEACFECLQQASEVIDVSMAQLLRACLGRLAYQGGGNVDLQKCLQELQKIREKAGASNANDDPDK